MRITKKFAGASCIGKQVYQPSEEMLSSDHSQLEIEELSVLKESFYRRVGDRTGLGELYLISFNCTRCKKHFAFNHSMFIECYRVTAV